MVGNSVADTLKIKSVGERAGQSLAWGSAAISVTTEDSAWGSRCLW